MKSDFRVQVSGFGKMCDANNTSAPLVGPRSRFLTMPYSFFKNFIVFICLMILHCCYPIVLLLHLTGGLVQLSMFVKLLSHHLKIFVSSASNTWIIFILLINSQHIHAEDGTKNSVASSLSF